MSPEGRQALKAALFTFCLFALFIVACVVYYTISKNRQIRELKAATQAAKQADIEAQRTKRDSGMELGTVKKAEVNTSSVYDLPVAGLDPVQKADANTSSVYDLPGGDLGTADREHIEIRDQVVAALCKVSGPKEQDAGTVRLEDVWEVGSIDESVAPNSPLTESRTGPGRSATVDSVASDDTRSTSSSNSESVNEWDEGDGEVRSRSGSSQRELQPPPPPTNTPVASPTGLSHVYGSHH